MSQEAAPNIDSGGQLQTESLRLTAFPALSAPVSEPSWWADLVGVQPETRTSRPGRGELQEAGPVGERTLALSVQPGRVDWLLTPRYEEVVPPDGRWAGPFRDALGVFEPLMTRWLGHCPPLVRLAFGVVVFEPVGDRVEGYRRLGEHLPGIHLDPDGSYDFFYQINRPRNSTVVETLKINRLSRWSVSRFVPIRLMIAPPSIQSAPVGAQQEACRIELDINTAAEFAGELPGARLAQLFEELKNLAVEIATRGDIP